MTKAELARVIVNELKTREMDHQISAEEGQKIDLENYWIDEYGCVYEDYYEALLDWLEAALGDEEDGGIGLLDDACNALGKLTIRGAYRLCGRIIKAHALGYNYYVEEE